MSPTRAMAIRRDRIRPGELRGERFLPADPFFAAWPLSCSPWRQVSALSPAGGGDERTAEAARERRNRQRPGDPLGAGDSRRHDGGRHDRGERNGLGLRVEHGGLGVVQPAHRRNPRADRGGTGGGRRARRDARRVQGGAFAAGAGGLPADRRRRQGVADLQGEEEHAVRDPRGSTAEFAAGALHDERLPAHPRGEPRRGRGCPRAARAGRSTASRTSTRLTPSACTRETAT